MGSVRSNSKQFDQCAAEDGFLFGVAEERRVQNQVHIGMPLERHIGSKDDLAGADFRHEMAQTLFGNNDRVDQNLALQVVARLLLVRAIGIGPHLAGDFGPPEIGRQVAARVRRADFQAGEAVECPVEHHARKENRGFQGISDDIAQVASSLERIFLEDILGALRMHENHNAKFLRLGPERIVLRQ